MRTLASVSLKNLAAFAAVFLLADQSELSAQQKVRVEITNNAPTGGVAITPVWFGFHNGSFDSYDNGSTAAAGLERIAEDGDTSQIAADFGADLTYEATGVTQTGTRVQGVLGAGSGPPPLQPGESAFDDFDIMIDGSNRYFSYASMVLPSNDFFIANGGAMAHDLMSLYDGDGFIEFQIGQTVNDAGTEINDFANSPGNPLFGFTAGQSMADQGAVEGGFITNVGADPYAGFLNAGFANGADLTGGPLNFSNYANGIATVRITAVPEPSSACVIGMGMIGLVLRRRRS